MSVPPGKKVFTAERRLLKGTPTGEATAGVSVAGTDPTAAARHQELMDVLALLRDELRGVRELKGTLTEDYKREILEAERLKRELQELSDAIAETKREIATLRLHHDAGDRLTVVTDELGAITASTEGATESILSAAEAIDDHANTLRIHVDTDYQAQVDDISEQVVHIFEACNFHDVTGQRITKVVNTLRFVEERVNRMMDILGGEAAFEGVEVARANGEAEKRLLNGPQMAGRKINQDEIDALFD